MARGLNRAVLIKAKHKLFKVARFASLDSCAKLLLIKLSIFVDIEFLGYKVVKIRNMSITIDIVRLVWEVGRLSLQLEFAESHSRVGNIFNGTLHPFDRNLDTLVENI